MKPFENIEIELLNDMTDASTITVDGIEFGFTGKIDFNNFDQKPIHEALRRMEWILKAYRDGNKDAAKWNFEHFCCFCLSLDQHDGKLS